MTSAVPIYSRPLDRLLQSFFFPLLSLLLSNVPLSIHSVHRGECHMSYTSGIENTIIRFYIYRIYYGMHTARTSCLYIIYILYTIIYNVRALCIFIIYVGTPTSRSTYTYDAYRKSYIYTSRG